MSSIQRLIDIMAQLRNPETGCAWDLKQDHQTLTPYLIEESYEVVDALEEGDPEEICAELGDLLFQVIFHSQLGEEKGLFDFEKVAAGICDKLVRRHPHVFAGKVYESDAEREAAWDQLKAEERAAKPEKNKKKNTGALDGVAKAQPALMRSQHLQRRAARVGFDWPDVNPVFLKIHEELDEVRDAINSGESKTRVEEEVGDLLFAAVNLARHLDLDAENALRMGNDKFERRFKGVENYLRKEGLKCSDVDLDKLEEAWEAVKRLEKQHKTA